MLAAELIRKDTGACFEEVPHGTGVEIITFREREGRDLIDIEANIYCERSRTRASLLKAGAMLKKSDPLQGSRWKTCLE